MMGHPMAAISYRLPLLALSDGDELALEGHDGTQIMIGCQLSAKGGGAIKHDTRPYPVAARVWPGQDPRRVGHGSLALHPGRECIELLDLLRGGLAILLVGLAEMGHEMKGLHHVLAVGQPLDKGGNILRPEPQPVHSRIKLEPGCDRCRQVGLLKQCQLIPGMNGGL